MFAKLQSCSRLPSVRKSCINGLGAVTPVSSYHHSHLNSANRLLYMRNEHAHAGGGILAYFWKRSYCKRVENKDKTLDTKWPTKWVHDKTDENDSDNEKEIELTTEPQEGVDVDKEMQRYNIEEFYLEDNEEEIVSERLTDADVDREMQRYNIDEFYGIEIQEQHIRPDRVDKFADHTHVGVRGVFDVEDIVKLLEEENMFNVCVISVPRESDYCEHMVIASGNSARHLKATCQRVRTAYKKRLKSGSVHIEGLKEKDEDWFAMDLRNIILHVFLEEARIKYDLETLWTVGSAYDEREHVAEEDFSFALPPGASLQDDPDLMFAELHKKFFQEQQPSSKKFSAEVIGQFRSKFEAGAAWSSNEAMNDYDVTIDRDDGEKKEIDDDTIDRDDGEYISDDEKTGYFSDEDNKISGNIAQSSDAQRTDSTFEDFEYHESDYERDDNKKSIHPKNTFKSKTGWNEMDK